MWRVESAPVPIETSEQHVSGSTSDAALVNVDEVDGPASCPAHDAVGTLHLGHRARASSSGQWAITSLPVALPLSTATITVAAGPSYTGERASWKPRWRASLAGDTRVSQSGSVRSEWSAWGEFPDRDLHTSGASVSRSSSGAGSVSAVRTALSTKWLELKHALKVIWCDVRGAPHTLAVALLCTLVFLALGLMAVFMASQSYSAAEKENARTLAEIVVLGTFQRWTAAWMPCTSSVTTAVLFDPRQSAVLASFKGVAAYALSQTPEQTVRRIDLAPFGRIKAFHPPSLALNASIIGYDALAPPSRWAADRKALQYTIQNNRSTVVFRDTHDSGLAAIVYHPVFVPGVDEGELFGMDRGPSDCLWANCYDHASRTKWWGAVMVEVDPQSLLRGLASKLKLIIEQGLVYQMGLSANGPLGNPSDIILQQTAAQGSMVEPQQATLVMPDGHELFLRVSNAHGHWAPHWRDGLVVLVVALSLTLGVLLFLLLLSHTRHKELVCNMLPRRVARRLAQGKHYVESFKDVTVLFSDIVSYTSMSSSMSPEELVELLNEVYTHYDSLVEKHGLYKVETIGDAFMCVGGCPESCHPVEAARRVASMALDMLEFTRLYKTSDGRRIQIRIGCYTGPVTAAVVGTKMAHMCLVGDTVNVASRMESTSLPGRIHVGATTARLLEGCPDFRLDPRGAIDIKGKGSMHTYWLLAPDPQHVKIELSPVPSRHKSAGPSLNPSVKASKEATTDPGSSMATTTTTESISALYASPPRSSPSHGSLPHPALGLGPLPGQQVSRKSSRMVRMSLDLHGAPLRSVSAAHRQQQFHVPALPFSPSLPQPSGARGGSPSQHLPYMLPHPHAHHAHLPHIMRPLRPPGSSLRHSSLSAAAQESPFAQNPLSPLGSQGGSSQATPGAAQGAEAPSTSLGGPLSPSRVSSMGV